MLCNKCGQPVNEGSPFCPNCGNRMKEPKYLFYQLIAHRDGGIQKEFVLWIGICVSFALFFMATILLGDASGYFDLEKDIRNFCVFSLVFSVPLGVFMAMRWKGVSILYGNIVFSFFLLISYYGCEKQIFLMYEGTESTTVIKVFYALALLAAIALIVCCGLHFFTTMHLERLILLCSILTVSLIVLMNVVPILLLDDMVELYEYCGELHVVMIMCSYFVILAMIAGYTIFYAIGLIDNTEKQLLPANLLQKMNTMGGGVNTPPQNMVRQQAPVGLQCIRGNYQGQAFPVQGEVILGSQFGQAHIVLQDSYVSRQHCVIRFNSATGYYEVKDISSNGVFLENGTRLQRGVYCTLTRGTVLCIGSGNQLFRLM